MPHDVISFFGRTKDRVFEVCAPLYRRGLSLREIEKQTGFSKSHIRETLKAHGLTLRSIKKHRTSKDKARAKMRPPIIPYGYAWMEGDMVVDPKEYQVVLEMVRLWKSGQSFAKIAKHLNECKIATRMGRNWSHPVVASIIQRNRASTKVGK
jgi:hypothetical protein